VNYIVAGVHFFMQAYILTRLLTGFMMATSILYNIRIKYRYKNWKQHPIYSFY